MNKSCSLGIKGYLDLRFIFFWIIQYIQYCLHFGVALAFRLSNYRLDKNGWVMLQPTNQVFCNMHRNSVSDKFAEKLISVFPVLLF